MYIFLEITYTKLHKTERTVVRRFFMIKKNFHTELKNSSLEQFKNTTIEPYYFKPMKTWYIINYFTLSELR